jgi:flagellar motor switch protein FliM
MPDSKDVDSMSQDEINELLGSLDDADPQDLAASSEPGEGASVKILDLDRPDPFSQEEIGRLRAIATGWSNEAKERLNGLSGAEVEITVDSVDVLTYAEYLRSVSNPGCFVEYDTPWGILLVEPFPSLASVLLSLATGCGPRAGSYESSSMSRRIVGAFVDAAIAPALAAEATKARLSLTSRGAKSDPSLLSTTDPYDMVALCCLAFRFEEIDETLTCNVALPRFLAHALVGERTERRVTDKNPQEHGPASPDIWLKGCIDFPFQNATGDLISTALEQGRLEADGETAGQIHFWPEGSEPRV